ncbi:MAG TPA: MarR family transcriptional regulator [Acidimicrobiia bacterium]|nr:MarR family transcriptional regulator [Acidimicrobiia bacterium]
MAETLLLDVWVLARLAGVAMDDAIAPSGLVSREFVLYALLDGAGPMTPTELARTSGVPATTISKMVKRMGERGHLVELDNPEDARSRLLQLSEEGRGVLDVAERGHAELAAEVATDLGDELAQVQWSLERLRRLLASRAGGDGARPEPSRPTEATVREVRYAGRILTAGEEAQAKQFIDFIRRKG